MNSATAGYLTKAARRAIYRLTCTFVWRAQRPKTMLRAGRPVDPIFFPDELLYLRCTRDAVETLIMGDGSLHRRVRPAFIHFPDQSVNREKYSRPWYVLLPDADDASRQWIFWGVAGVPLSGLPPPQQTAGNVRYEFTVEHDPLDDNYGHSELRVYKDGERETDKKKINATVKKIYRQLLSEQTRVIIEPLN